MTAGPLGVKHPSKAAFLLAALTAAIAFFFTMSAIFVPWSWKDSAVLQRTYIGLWQHCVEYTNDPLNWYMCHENDIDIVGSIAGGSEKCRGYIAATQVFTVAGNVFAFLAMVCCFLVVGKLWSKPLALAAYAAMNAFLAFRCILVAFLPNVVLFAFEQKLLSCQVDPVFAVCLVLSRFSLTRARREARLSR